MSADKQSLQSRPAMRSHGVLLPSAGDQLTVHLIVNCSGIINSAKCNVIITVNMLYGITAFPTTIIVLLVLILFGYL